MALATRVAVMARGRFLQIATPEEIYHRPAMAEVARFIGRSAVLSGRLRIEQNGVLADLGGACVPVAPAAPRERVAEIVVRPNDIVLGDGPLSGRIAQVFYRGGVWEGRVEVAGFSEPLPVASERRIADGERCASASSRLGAAGLRPQIRHGTTPGGSRRPARSRTAISTTVAATVSVAIAAARLVWPPSS